MKFKDKNVLVTGSSRGLGRRIALEYAKEGANVIINYNKSKEASEELKKELDEYTGNHLLIEADVSNYSLVEDMFAIISKEFEYLDILVNNAGIYEDSVVWKMDEKIWDNIIQTDLSSVFYCTKFAIQSMRKRGYGRVLNISSVVGQTGAFGTSNYSAAKAGIFGFTKSVAKEVASKKITINSLAVGFIEEGMLLRLPEEVQKSIIKQIPIGRWGKPKELIDTVFFFTSKEASYITGQTINVNGGYYP